MLPKTQRLRQGQEILNVIRWGKSSAGRSLVIQHMPSRRPVTQLAIVVSRRVSKHAVDRNRVKRRLRAILAKLQPQLPPNTAILVRVRPPAITQRSATLSAELHNLFRRAKLLP